MMRLIGKDKSNSAKADIAEFDNEKKLYSCIPLRERDNQRLIMIKKIGVNEASVQFVFNKGRLVYNL